MPSKTKHFDLDIQQKHLHLTHIPGTTQIVDILTKPLTATSFHSFRNKLMVVPNPTINLRGDIS